MYPLMILSFAYIIFNNLCVLTEINANEIPEIKIFGPGLDPVNIVHPARYFTVQVRNYNLSNTENLIKFKARGRALDYDRQCRLWANILDCKNGSYFLRYRLYEPCTLFKLEITYKNQHIGESPYEFGDNVILNEDCNCPKWDLTTWLRKNRCGAVPDQINNDLKPFPIINWDHIRSEVIKQFHKPEQISICHYLIYKNELYRTCYGKHVGFNRFADDILLSLLRKMQIPDLEFFINLGDWPLVRRESTLFPIFSWCGSEDTFDIVMPTYDITGSSLDSLGKVTLDMLSVQGNSELPWKKRKSQVFWRGRDSNRARLDLIDLAREDPELFNVSITHFFFYGDRKEKYGPSSPPISFFKFFDYKYQLSIDGTVAAYRLPYLLAGGSLVFKQESKYYEHFYHQLQPYKHFIPIKRDLSDLHAKIQWARANDRIAEQIAQQAQSFANQILLPQDIYCYHGHLLNTYATHVQPVSLDALSKGMEHVHQPAQDENCVCRRDQKSQNVKQEL